MKSKLLLIIAALFLLIGGFTFENRTNCINFNFITERKLVVGEEITYVVSYSFIKLGEVKLKIKDKKEVNGKNVYFTVAYINSYPGVPLVDLHQIYESKVNQEYFSEFFRGIVKYPDYSTFTEYNFDYSKSAIRIKKGKVNPHQLWTDSAWKTDKMLQDGLSIFYFARMNLGTKKTINVPCFVNEKKEYTKINFYPEVQKINIDAVKYDISCLRLDGETNFVSVFGLTGYFEGWFSNDEASIPLIAKMKVIIGNVQLELKEWKREGWIPPKYKS